MEKIVSPFKRIIFPGGLTSVEHRGSHIQLRRQTEKEHKILATKQSHRAEFQFLIFRSFFQEKRRS